MQPRILVIYHADCPDGFGGAYAAWKKFGEKAEYRGMRHGDAAPRDVVGAEVYLIDFSFSRPELERLESEAKSLVVLDHHESEKESVEAVREHVYDNDRSGATIAWDYFHPGTPPPRMLTYIEDFDLWRNALPHTREIDIYLATLPYDFQAWDLAATKLDNEDGFRRTVERGAHYKEYFDHAVRTMLDIAEEVTFDGRQVRVANVPRIMHTEAGFALAKKFPPLALTYYRNGGNWKFSLRGDGSIDCAALAKKFGGGGHHDKAGFTLPGDAPFPFISL